MRKMPTLFIRDPSNPFRVINQVNVACQWVADGEGVATRKWDGQPLFLLDGLWYKRYTGCLDGYSGNATGAMPCGCEEDTTPVWWVQVSHTKEDQHILEAIREARLWDRKHNGTYEICGPHFCHNRENLDVDKIIRHGTGGMFTGCPVEFQALLEWLQSMDIEGVVWHHPDGRFAKIKKSDFGLRRNTRLNGLPPYALLGPDGVKVPVADRESDPPEAHFTKDGFQKLPVGEVSDVRQYDIGGEA